MVTCKLANFGSLDFKLNGSVTIIHRLLPNMQLHLTILSHKRIGQLEHCGLHWHHNDLVHVESDRANDLLSRQIVQLAPVDCVINLQFELLMFLEPVVQVDCCNKLRKTISLDAFCLPHLLSLLAFVLPEHAESVTHRLSAHDWQVGT